MKLPWTKKKPILNREIKLTVGTLATIADQGYLLALDDIEAFIAERRAAVPEAPSETGAAKFAQRIYDLDLDGPYR